jgi:energy-coupling factor transport system substrate-specific component
MAAVIVVGGVAKGYWGSVRFITEALFGPFSSAVLSGFFYMWGILAAFAIRKFGAGTLTMTIGAYIELLAGNPFGQLVYVYDFLEGLCADIAFAIFRYKLPSNRTKALLVSGLIGVIMRLLHWPDQIFFFGYIKQPPATLAFLIGSSAVAMFFWGMITLGIYRSLIRLHLVPFVPPDQMSLVAQAK